MRSFWVDAESFRRGFVSFDSDYRAAEIVSFVSGFKVWNCSTDMQAAIHAEWNGSERAFEKTARFRELPGIRNRSQAKNEQFQE